MRKVFVEIKQQNNLLMEKNQEGG